MAVVLITKDGCVLNHSAAVAAAYRTCNLPAFSSNLGLNNYHETERTVREHTVSALPEPVVGVSSHAKRINTGDSKQSVQIRNVPKQPRLAREHTISALPQTVEHVPQLEHPVNISGFVGITGTSEQATEPSGLPGSGRESTGIVQKYIFESKHDVLNCLSEHSLAVPHNTVGSLMRHNSDANSGHHTIEEGGGIHVEQIDSVCPSLVCSKDSPVAGYHARHYCETAACSCFSACPMYDHSKQPQTDYNAIQNDEEAKLFCDHENTISKTDQNTDFCGQNKASLCMNCDIDPVIRDLPRNLHSHQTENKARHENHGPTGEVLAVCNKVSNVSPVPHSRRSVSLALKHGFFAVKIPYMMDSQFEKVDKHFAQVAPANSDHVKICVADIQQVVSTKRKRKKTEAMLQNSEEEKLHKVYLSLTHAAREQGILLQHIPLPLDNNLLSRQCAQLDHFGDVFNSLLVTGDGQPVLHMGDSAEALEINTDGCTLFSAPSLIHRKVSHPKEEATVVSVDGTDYLLPSCCQFLLSNLEDFCDHLYSQLDENFYDLIVLDPPWENKSVKRKRSYDTVNEDELLNIPVAVLGKPGSLVALWITNNDRLEDYAQNTLFPAWGIRAVARWHWIKVTQTGHLISSMDGGHKKPYEVLLLGRLFSNSAGMPVEKEELPEAKVIISIPCSLHSKKPPLGEVLHPYLPPNPQCLELFARNLWPGWTSWGQEALKHQNMMFYEEIDSFSPSFQQ